MDKIETINSMIRKTNNNTKSLPLNEKVCLIRLWEQYLLKRGLIKHTCSWRDKRIVLRTLNRQAKIFLCIKTSTLNFLKNMSQFFVSNVFWGQSWPYLSVNYHHSLLKFFHLKKERQIDLLTSFFWNWTDIYVKSY